MSEGFWAFAYKVEPIADTICNIGLVVLGVYLAVTFTVMFLRERKEKKVERPNRRV